MFCNQFFSKLGIFRAAFPNKLAIHTKLQHFRRMEVNDIHQNNLLLLNESKKANDSHSSNREVHTNERVNLASKAIAKTVECKAGKNNGCNKVFVQTLNPTEGKLEWLVQEEDYDYTQEVARSAYADMLHDDERNELYYAGLIDAVRILRSRGERVRVLDIGTGTGLLSMMAVSCGADVVTACEAFEPMAECAEKILLKNNMSKKVRVVHKRSTELIVGPGQDMEQRANLLVAEVFDTELIGEGAIGTYDHARKHLLTADALLVPSAARVYAQVISSPLLHSFNKPNAYIPPHQRHLKMPQSFSTCPGSIGVHDIQMSQLKESMFTPVSQPLTVFSFDWSGRTIPLTREETTHNAFIPLSASSVRDGSHQKDRHCQDGASSDGFDDGSNSPDLTASLELSSRVLNEKTKQKPTSNGSHQVDGDDEEASTSTCHAVLMWWDLTMDQGGDVILTCAPHWHYPHSNGPDSIPWRDHWMQAVYHLAPPLVQLTPGSGLSRELTLTAARDEYSMWFAVTDPSLQVAPARPPAPHCTCGVHMATPRTRLAQLADPTRLHVIWQAVDEILENTSSTSSRATSSSSQCSEGCPGQAWLLLGDGVNLLTVAQLHDDARACHVFVYDSSQQGRRVLSQFVQLNDMRERVTLLPFDDSTDQPSHVRHKIGVVFSEPHFNTSILPWHNLRANLLMNEHIKEFLLPGTSLTIGSSSSSTSSTGTDTLSDAPSPKTTTALNTSAKDTSSATRKTPAESMTCNIDSSPATDALDSTSSSALSPASGAQTATSTAPAYLWHGGILKESGGSAGFSSEGRIPLLAGLPAGVRLLPVRMSVHVLPVCFLHLWKIRAPCVRRCGFDLGIFDELIDQARCHTDDYIEAQPLWEYPCYALTPPLHVATYDLSADLSSSSVHEIRMAPVPLDVELLSERVKGIQSIRNSVFGTRGDRLPSANSVAAVAFTSGGTTIDAADTSRVGDTASSTEPNPVANSSTDSSKDPKREQGSAVAAADELFYNGVAVWVDWHLDERGERMISTGPVEEVLPGRQVEWSLCHQQGVHLPRKTLSLLQRDAQGRLLPRHFSCNFKTNKGQLNFQFDMQ